MAAPTSTAAVASSGIGANPQRQRAERRHGKPGAFSKRTGDDVPVAVTIGGSTDTRTISVQTR